MQIRPKEDDLSAVFEPPRVGWCAAVLGEVIRQAALPVTTDKRYIRAGIARREKGRRRVVAALLLAAGPLRPVEVAACSSMSTRLATRLLRALVAEGKAFRVGPRGAFRYSSISAVVINEAAVE